MEFSFDKRFLADFRRVKKRNPRIVQEFDELLASVEEIGEIPPWYGPHMLMKPRARYSGLQEFHLAEGKLDVLVVYGQRGRWADIRFMRIGSHDELFG